MLVDAPEPLPPVDGRGDRAAAHFYRAMHARSQQREQEWKQKYRAAEQIIKQLLVLVAYCVEKIAALTRQVAWLNKQQFGNKSESTPSSPSAPEGSQPADGSESKSAESAEQSDAQGAPGKGKRKRGQQPGGKGPKRQRRANLSVEIVHHTIPESERTCSICHETAVDTGLTEESERIEWEVRLKRCRDVRHIYRGCGCGCRPRMMQGVAALPSRRGLRRWSRTASPSREANAWSQRRSAPPSGTVAAARRSASVSGRSSCRSKRLVASSTPSTRSGSGVEAGGEAAAIRHSHQVSADRGTGPTAY